MWDAVRTSLSRLKALFVLSRERDAFDEEVQTHLAMLEDSYLQRGLTPRAAALAARKQFGNATLLKQRQREKRATMMFEDVWRDVRYAVRQLWKTPVFTLVCVLTLALGVGANTAVFSVMHAVLMKLLPVSDPSRVFYLHTTGWPDGAMQTGDSSTSFSYPVYKALRESGGLQDVMAFIPMSFNGRAPVRVGTVPEEAAGDMVSGNYFSGLGVPMQLGRPFGEKDETDHTAVTVISDSFWSSHFSRNHDVVGKTLFIKSVPFTIVGVAAKGFEGTEGRLPLAFWIPLQSRPEFNAWGNSVDNGFYLNTPTYWCMKLMARTRAGVSREQALAQAQTIFARAAYTGVERKPNSSDSLKLSFMEAKQFDSQDDSFKQTLQTLMAMVGLVLLIAMSNVVMLLLARNSSRQREFGVRLALGAGRRELARQLLTESLLLVTMGGIAAWLFALAATRALGIWSQVESNLQPDRTVLWFTLSILFVLALVFGLAPLRSAMASGPDKVLRNSAKVSQASGQTLRTGNIVIVAQIAMCVVLLVGAGLLLGTLRNLLRMPLGEKPDGLLVFGIRPTHTTTKEATVAFYNTLQQRLRTLPGVLSVSMAENRPGSGWSNNNSGIRVDGHDPNGVTAEQASFRRNSVGSDFFHTMGVPVLMGRDFSDGDTASSPVVVVVNETFARKYFGSLNVIGHTVSDPSGKQSATIVGLVKDHKYTGITEEAMPMIWGDFAQGGPESQLEYEVRFAGDPLAVLPAVRKVVGEMDADMPLLEPMTQTAVFERSISQQILFARLAGCFGVLAVLLIATGLYGTLAYRVNRRTAEIGVRMALGARREQVVWMVLKGSLLLCLAGVTLGLPLAFFAGKGLQSSLYGMKPLDLTSYAAAIAGVACVALLASAVPASRAAGVNPTEALRLE